MPRLVIALLFAWLAAPAASHAALPSAALADLVSDDAERRAAAVTALGSIREAKWLAVLGALRDGGLYARTTSGTTELVIGGAKSARGEQEVIEIRSIDGAALGVVPLADLKGVSADRRLRLLIKPFLDADETRLQLADADPAARRAAAVKLGNQADPAAAPMIEAALAREQDRWARHALSEALALIRLAHGDAAARIEAARTLGGLHSSAGCRPCGAWRPTPRLKRAPPPRMPSPGSSAGGCSRKCWRPSSRARRSPPSSC